MKQSKISAAPIGTYFLAKEYLEAATKVAQPPRNEHESLMFDFSIPAYYLVCHSIELSLKAFLLGHGVSDKLLSSKSKGFGHNLSGLMSESRRKKLGLYVVLTKKDQDIINRASSYYSDKMFEYRISGKKYIPYYEDVYGVALKLVIGVEKYCFKKLSK